MRYFLFFLIAGLTFLSCQSDQVETQKSDREIAIAAIFDESGEPYSLKQVTALESFQISIYDGEEGAAYFADKARKSSRDLLEMIVDSLHRGRECKMIFGASDSTNRTLALYNSFHSAVFATNLFQTGYVPIRHLFHNYDRLLWAKTRELSYFVAGDSLVMERMTFLNKEKERLSKEHQKRIDELTERHFANLEARYDREMQKIDQMSSVSKAQKALEDLEELKHQVNSADYHGEWHSEKLETMKPPLLKAVEKELEQIREKYPMSSDFDVYGPVF